MRQNKIIIGIVSLVLLLIITSCAKDVKPTLKPKEVEEVEVIKVDYSEEVENFNLKLKEILAKFGLQEELILESKEEDKQKKVNDYQFSWEYNYRQLQFPLFGPNGRLLSRLKDDIVQRLKEEFPIVEVNWQNKEKQKLTIKIAFHAQSDSLKVVTHKLQFIQERPKAKMAIVIDDFGFAREGTDKILSINRPLTMAVLPFRPHSFEQAKRAKKLGYEVILHQPLEPTNPKVNPGQGAIYTTMTATEIKDTLKNNLDNLPQVVGVNHHMGSKASANNEVMTEIIKFLKKRDLFYVDSSTSHKSIGAQVAREYQVPTAENYLFIDNVDKKEEVKKMLLRLAKIALEKKELVVIGHVRTNTALAIEELLPTLEEMGVKLVFVSQLVK